MVQSRFMLTPCVAWASNVGASDPRTGRLKSILRPVSSSMSSNLVRYQAQKNKTVKTDVEPRMG